MSVCTVTGATGFIGSLLVKTLLENGETVRCLVRASSNTERLNGLDVELRQTDFSDIDSLKSGIQGSDIVYHCAGCIKSLHKEEMYQVNCENTKRLAQACLNSDSAPRFIFVSSLAAGGPMKGKDAPLREEWMTENPVSVYGRSKLAAEMELRKISPNLPISVIRPPMVLGPGDKCSLKMFQVIQNSGFQLCPGWERKRYTVVFSEDVVKTLILAAEKGTRLTDCTESGNPENSYQSGIYFVARDENPEYGELGELIGKKMGRKWTIAWHFARPVFWTLSYIIDGVNRLRNQNSILNLDKAAEAIAGSWICSNEKAKRELGFVADGDLSSHLDEVIADYRARGWLK
ncbi:MAG: NAD-dependent epimerase/dehydratase family protein [Thermoguttaceae bacterium]|nr:NAD-dependent epimerase/dehydratase family protein [Thermoguttaceae bacterium]